MANIKSQIKRDRQNIKAHDRNTHIKSNIKTLIKNVHAAVDREDVEEAKLATQKASRALDKAKSSKVMHKNQVANKKSAIAKKLNTLFSK